MASIVKVSLRGRSRLGCAVYLIAVVILLGAESAVWASATSELYRTQGLLSLSQGDNDAALKLFQQAVAEDATDMRARYFCGVANSRVGRYPAAIQDLEAARDAHLAFDKLWFELGYAYYRDARLEQAQSALSQSLVARPDHAPSHYYLGLVHYQRGGYTESLAPLESAARLNPAFGASSAYLRGDALVRLGRSAEAKQLLTESIAKYPQSVYANPMQELLDSMGRPERWSDRFDVLLATGVVYDSNVGLFPDNAVLLPSVDDDADFRLEVSADIQAHLVRDKVNDVSLGYRFFDSAHQDLDEFDVQSHALLANASRTWQNITLGLNYQFITADLDNDDFSDVHMVTPNLTWLHNRERFSLFLFEWRNNDYDPQTEQGRSGNLYRARYRHYWLGTQHRYGYAEAGLVADDTDDRNFQYQGYRFDFGYQHAWGEVRANSGISYERRSYNDSVNDRDDEHTEISVRLTKPLRYGFELEGALMQIINPSNVDVFDYSRTVASLNILYRK